MAIGILKNIDLIQHSYARTETTYNEKLNRKSYEYDNQIKGKGDIGGTQQDDWIEGSRKSDTINGHDGWDCILGLGGNDIIHCGDGVDQAYGGGGDDSIFGDNGDDWLYGDEGDDWIDGGNGNDILYGGDGNDVLNGGNGDNILNGGNGSDTMYAWNSNNRMNGGKGNDIYYITHSSEDDYSNTIILQDKFGKDIAYGLNKNDTLNFQDLENSGDLKFKIDGSDLTIRFGKNSITINNYFNAESKVDRIKAKDGKTYSIAELLETNENSLWDNFVNLFF